MNIVTKTWLVGTAQRDKLGAVLHYTIGRQEFKSTWAVRSYIEGLRISYAAGDIKIRSDEFVPVQIKTTYILPE